MRCFCIESSQTHTTVWTRPFVFLCGWVRWERNTRAHAMQPALHILNPSGSVPTFLPHTCSLEQNASYSWTSTTDSFIDTIGPTLGNTMSWVFSVEGTCHGGRSGCRFFAVGGSAGTWRAVAVTPPLVALPILFSSSSHAFPTKFPFFSLNSQMWR